MATPDPYDHINPKKRKGEMANNIVLCFDGTGNKFQANESDTNVVKLYQMLDRNCPGQYHYYQPGIGTYVQDQTSNSSSGNFFTRIKTQVVSTLDEMVGTSFVTHVLSGYKFLMRYYTAGSQIWIFGFSRGAYTARFLAEMVQDIGLLSMGNEEMVHFAWTTFSDWQTVAGENTPDQASKLKFMHDFKDTFCRPNVNIHFLGLFDCVNSVGSFEIPWNKKSYKYIAKPSATHTRHAVSIHERRLKFKPAVYYTGEGEKSYSNVKEVWFPGNHGDIGGGWAFANKQQNELLSDEPLRWMIQEILDLPEENKIEFRTTSLKNYKYRETAVQKHVTHWFWGLWPWKKSTTEIRREDMRPHDMLRAGGGSAWYMFMVWWFIESLPFMRLELEYGKWVPRHWPPNYGASRDIPARALIHKSLWQLYESGSITAKELPKLGGDDPPQWWNPFTFFQKKNDTGAPPPYVEKAPLESGGTTQGSLGDPVAKTWKFQ